MGRSRRNPSSACSIASGSLTIGLINTESFDNYLISNDLPIIARGLLLVKRGDLRKYDTTLANITRWPGERLRCDKGARVVLGHRVAQERELIEGCAKEGPA